MMFVSLLRSLPEALSKKGPIPCELFPRPNQGHRLTLPALRDLREQGASLASIPKRVCSSCQLHSFPTYDSPTCLLDSHTLAGTVSPHRTLFHHRVCSGESILLPHPSPPQRGKPAAPLWVCRHCLEPFAPAVVLFYLGSELSFVS